MLTDAEKIRELARLHTELRALEAEYAATTAAIREHINELCGLRCGTTTYKERKRALTRGDFARACGL